MRCQLGKGLILIYEVINAYICIAYVALQMRDGDLLLSNAQ